MKLTLLLEKGEWKLGKHKKINPKAGELIFTCILVRKRKKVRETQKLGKAVPSDGMSSSRIFLLEAQLTSEQVWSASQLTCCNEKKKKGDSTSQLELWGWDLLA